MKSLRQEFGEGKESVSGQRRDPAIQGQGIVLEARPLGISALFVVARWRGIDVDIVKHDAVDLLMMLAAAEFLDELVRWRVVVTKNPQSVPALFASFSRFANDNGAGFAGSRPVLGLHDRCGLGDSEPFAGGSFVWPRFLEFSP